MSAEYRVWIADRWFKADKSKSANYGKGDRWRVVWIDPETKRERSRAFAKKVDAEAFETATENALREGVYAGPEIAALTVGDAVEAWLSSKKSPKAASLAKYRSATDDYVLPRWQGTPLGKVKRLDIDTWVTALQNGSAPRRPAMRGKSTGLSPASISNVLVPFVAGLRFAVAEGWLKKNPAEGVEVPVAKSEPVVFLTYPELEHLIDVTAKAATAQDALMVAVMGNIGLRIGEVVALNVGSVNLAKRRISITATITTNAQGKPVLGDSPKTEAGNRDVPIPPHLIDALRAQTKGRAATAPLFASTTGSRLSLSNWRNRVWSKVTKAADVPEGLTPKGLRHTAASLAIASGADVLMVQRMLGHADAKETLNTYAKLFPDRMDEVTDRMSKARAKALKKGRIPGLDQPSS